MKRIHYLPNPDSMSAKLLLLYRFHLVVIVVNLLAIGIDIFSQRYINVILEVCVVIALSFNLFTFYNKWTQKHLVYLFIFIVSTALFIQIHLAHFASMSIIFMMLLPLISLLFLKTKESIVITILMFSIILALLYHEYLYNPSNPLIQNMQALFNLAYAAIIVYIFGLLYHFSILKTFDELDASNRQKELLLKEVHHRVKNNLNVIASIVGLQGNLLAGSEKEQLQKTKSRIESIAIVHEMLYKYEDFENVNFDSYIQKLSQLLLNMYMTSTLIKIDIKSDIKSMPLDVMVQLGIMVNELLTNTIKYAFKSDKGQISIELSYHDKIYHFSYSDDGIGHTEPESLLNTKSLGIKLIKLTSKQLKADLKISSPKGLRYDIEFSS